MDRGKVRIGVSAPLEIRISKSEENNFEKDVDSEDEKH